MAVKGGKCTGPWQVSFSRGFDCVVVVVRCFSVFAGALCLLFGLWWSFAGIVVMVRERGPGRVLRFNGLPSTAMGGHERLVRHERAAWMLCVWL